jgi:RNA polymerase sigma-70 factor (ECF subfamily)
MDHAGDTAARLDQLVAEIGWVRRLARALVHDAATADDVAQDAWIQASEGVPDDGRPLRPWLYRVVQNAARMRFRGARRRAARDEQAELVREVATPAELVERVELSRVVADEVLALGEPYRSTVLLHYVEGLSSAQIARRLDAPAGTVRRRLKVALDQLRARLRERLGEGRAKPGGRPAWLAALIPLAIASDPRPAAATTLGVLVMKKLIVVVGVLVVLALIAVWWRARGEAPRAVMTAARAEPVARPAQVAKALEAVPGWLVQPGVAGRRIAGRVTAPAGALGEPGPGLAGAVVRLALAGMADATQPIAEQRAGADGGFDFGVQPAAVFVVSAEAASHAPASQVIAVADPRARPEQIALELGACRSRVYGSVLDASGGAIGRARLLGAGLSGVQSDDAGRYSLCLPDINTQVRVEAEGYGTAVVSLHLFGELRRDVVLVPEAVLVGRVVADGAPVAGALVIARPGRRRRGAPRRAGRWPTPRAGSRSRASPRGGSTCARAQTAWRAVARCWRSRGRRPRRRSCACRSSRWCRCAARW